MDFENLEADVTMIIPCHYTSGRGGNSINKVILHHNAGDLTVEDCYSVWSSREASAHYQVESNGRIGQLVNDWDTAWHAGDWNANTTAIGIEHADCSSSPWAISDECVEAGAHLTAAVCKMYGLGRPTWGVNVFGHSDFSATACPASLAVGGADHDRYMDRAGEWYDAMCDGTEPSPIQPSSPSTSTDSSDFHVHMQAESQGTVLEEVMDNNDNAGIDEPMTYLSAWGDGFDLVVQANDLPELHNPSNINDHENGAVGDGSPITKLRMFSYFPNGDKRIWYRAMTQNSYPNYLPWMKDDIDTGGSGDNYAGDGSPIYRVEAFVGDL